MICPKCKTRNPIGNKFCRECGEPLVLPEGSLAAEEAARVEAEREAEKVAALLAQSHALADARKFDEAIPLAIEAAQILPNSTSAHSLLATLYERTEQEPKAIAAMETVVRLNPGSVADQIKLDQLKRGIHVLPRSVPVGSSPSRLQESAPLPWMPLALGGGVVVVVLGAGLWWLNRSQAARQPTTRTISRPVTAPTAPPISAANPSGIAPVYVAPSPGATPLPRFSTATVPGPPPPASQVRDDPFASQGLGPRPQQTIRATPAPARRSVPPVTTSTAPNRSTTPVAPVTIVPPPGVGAGTTSPNGLPPISAGPPQNGGTETSDGSSTGGGQPATSGFGAGGRIPVGPPSQTSPDTTGQGANNRTSGSGDSYIHISVGSSGAKRSSGTSTSSGGSVAPSSPLARARALQQSGLYRQAIGAYREAANGSSAGSAYQGMAQCYESLSDTGGAKSAYRDAIRAYTAQGSASAQRGINSCKAALEVLGGG